MAQARMAHASTHGARKPPGPKVNIDFLLQKHVILCPMMFHTKFELNRSIIERKKFEAMSEDTSADVLGNINIG